VHGDDEQVAEPERQAVPAARARHAERVRDRQAGDQEARHAKQEQYPPGRGRRHVPGEHAGELRDREDEDQVEEQLDRAYPQRYVRIGLPGPRCHAGTSHR
jgi:hypothetical protein